MDPLLRDGTLKKKLESSAILIRVRFLPILLLATALFAQKPAPTPKAAPGTAPKAPPPSSTAVQPDDGRLKGNVYRSDYFHFTYTIPAELDVMGDFLGAEEDAEHRSFVLLAAYSEADAEGAKSGAVIMADRVRDYVPLSPEHAKEKRAGDSIFYDGKAYLDAVILPLATRQGYELLNGPREYTIGGQKFYRADYRKNDVRQSFVFTVLRGYAVGFNLVGPGPADIERLFESLQTLKFGAAAAARKTPQPQRRREPQ